MQFIISHHEVYLALDNTCQCFTAVDGDVTCIAVPALQSFHEEADTMMALHLYLVAHVQEATNITIRRNGTEKWHRCAGHTAVLHVAHRCPSES